MIKKIDGKERDPKVYGVEAPTFAYRVVVLKSWGQWNAKKKTWSDSDLICFETLDENAQVTGRVTLSEPELLLINEYAEIDRKNKERGY